MGNRINSRAIEKIDELINIGKISSDEGVILTCLLKGKSPKEIMEKFPQFDKKIMTDTVKKIYNLDGVEITEGDIVNGRIQSGKVEILDEGKRINDLLGKYVDQCIMIIKESQLQGQQEASEKLLKTLLFRLRGIDKFLQKKIKQIEAILPNPEQKEKQRRGTLKNA